MVSVDGYDGSAPYVTNKTAEGLISYFRWGTTHKDGILSSYCLIVYMPIFLSKRIEVYYEYG